MESKDLALLCAKTLDDKKGQDILVIAVAHRTIIADFLVLASGRSVPQVKALLDAVEEQTGKQGISPRRREGAAEGRWAVLDYGAVIVHIFHEQEREYYQLERLWLDGTNEVPFQATDNG